MTCIVGLVDKGSVYLGGDSAGVDTGRYSLVVRADRKVFCNGEFVMGFTSSFRMGQLLAHAFKPPPLQVDEDVYAYMVTRFIDGVRDCLKAGGYAKKEHEVEEGGSFLVGFKGRLFTIDGDYQVGEGVDGYSACGCGDLIALGSLFSTTGQSPTKRLRTALEAAERFSAGVRAPFHYEIASS